ncbi:hypothetical protein BRADI_1g31486v3 [Brachypodium distachyon]|uniref:F-box domain-containing protein n=2 Tax=Brachypodium distachyon TaxID=15368 RepID=A0A0Q3JGF8_BRADI|nr:hypothetical protein BRADI_1g31486v3 [Brachypodium distachyon]
MPVKSLCRFRCVSKRWRALIADPAFVAARRRRHVLITSSPSKEPGSSKRHDLQLMDMDGSVVRVIEGVGFFSTVFCPNLPDSPICLTRDASVLLTFPIFGPGGVSYSFSIGRAAMSGAYKVVRLGSRWGCHVEQTCEVLTLGGGGVEWRRSQPPQTRIRARYCQSSVAAAAVNGVMYFLRDFDYYTVIPQVDDDGDDYYVLCFDLESEEWKKMIKGPLKVSDESWTSTEATGLAELNGALYMVQLEETFGHPSTNIWLLVDPKESIWVKTYTISMARTTSLVVPRVMSHGTKLLISIFRVYNLGPTLQVYDARTGLCIDVMKTSNNLYGGIGLCSLHMHHFVSAEI